MDVMCARVCCHGFSRHVVESFSQVLYWPEGALAPQRGTVAKIRPGDDDEQASVTYFVALSGTQECCACCLSSTEFRQSSHPRSCMPHLRPH